MDFKGWIRGVGGILQSVYGLTVGAGGVFRIKNLTQGTSAYMEVYHDGTQGIIYSGANGGRIRSSSNPIWYIEDTGGVKRIALSGHSSPAGVGLTSDVQLWWTSAATDPFNSRDTGLARAAAGVVKTTDGSSGAGWIQNTAGRSRVSGSNVTNNTTTMTNITGLSATLIAGRTYSGCLYLIAGNSTPGDGLKFDFDGGTCTATTFAAAWMSTVASTSSTYYTTSLAGDLIQLNNVSSTGCLTIIYFNITVNAGGTFIPRFAENSSTPGLATVYIGSCMLIEDMP